MSSNANKPIQSAAGSMTFGPFTEGISHANQVANASPDWQPAKPEITEQIRAWYRAIGKLGGGFRNIPHEQRVLNGKIWARSNWIKRKKKWPNGQPQKPYTQWCKEHGKPLPSQKEGAQ